MPPPTSVTLDLSDFLIRHNLPQTTTMYTPNVTFDFWVQVSVSGLTQGVRPVTPSGPLTSKPQRMFDQKQEVLMPLGYQILIPVQSDDTGIAVTVFLKAEAGGQYTTAPDSFFRVSMHYDASSQNWQLDRGMSEKETSEATLEATSDNVKLADNRKGEAVVYGKYVWQNEKPYFEGLIRFAI